MNVLRVLTRANVGGPMRQALALWRADEAVGTRTLLVVGACAEGESEMPMKAVPELAEAELHEGCRGVFRARRLGRDARPWRDVRATRELRRLIRRFRPDVVHTHTSQAGFFGRRAAFAEGVPCVAHTFHGHVLRDYYRRPVSALFRRLEARLARRTDQLFAVSESCRDELHTLGVGEGRIATLPPAVDVSAFRAVDRGAARGRLGLADGTLAIGLVGRLVPIKRPRVFVDTVAALPDARGFVFGDGPLRDVVCGHDRVDWRGSRADLPELLPALDAVILCSRREGCPLVAVEAFAAGVPVVGFDVPGVRDVLTSWGAGIVVPEAAGEQGLARAVRSLREDPSRSAELVATARRGLSRFEPVAVARALRDRYEVGRAAAAD